jgi:hypothetical protein
VPDFVFLLRSSVFVRVRFTAAFGRVRDLVRVRLRGAGAGVGGRSFETLMLDVHDGDGDTDCDVDSVRGLWGAFLVRVRVRVAVGGGVAGGAGETESVSVRICSSVGVFNSADATTVGVGVVSAVAVLTGCADSTTMTHNSVTSNRQPWPQPTRPAQRPSAVLMCYAYKCLHTIRVGRAAKERQRDAPPLR